MIFVPLLSFAYYDPGQPQGFVSDFGEMIQEEVENQLETELADFERTRGHEIAVVTLPSLKGDTIENFAVKLFQDWGIGEKNTDNGVLLLVAREERTMRIEVGYGLEPVLTDVLSAQIIRNILRPAFQEGEFDKGITQAVAAVEKITQGEEVYFESSEENIPPNIILVFVILGFIPLFFRFLLLFMVSVGKTRSWWKGGILMAGLSAFLSVAFWTVSPFGVITFIFVMTMVGFILDYIASRTTWIQKFQRGSRRLPREGFWFFGGGGRHGKDGFGGFGGGGSGGGGASGNW